MLASLYPVYKSVYTAMAMVRVPFLFHVIFRQFAHPEICPRHNKGEMTDPESIRARHVAQHVAQPCTGPLRITQPLSALPAFPGSLGDCSHQVWPAAHSSGWGCSTFHIRKWGRRGRLGGQRGGFFHWSKREKKGPDKTTEYSCKTGEHILYWMRFGFLLYAVRLLF